LFYYPLMATATYTHYVVRSCSLMGGYLNQGFGSTPEEAWADAVGPDQNVELFKFKVKDARKSHWWLCVCDKEFCDSYGYAGKVGPACDDPTE